MFASAKKASFQKIAQKSPLRSHRSRKLPTMKLINQSKNLAIVSHIPYPYELQDLHD